MSYDFRNEGGEPPHLVPQHTTHQLPGDIEDNNDEGEDQECAACEDKQRRLLNKRKLGREVGKAERRIIRRRYIPGDGHGP